MVSPGRGRGVDLPGPSLEVHVNENATPTRRTHASLESPSLWAKSNRTTPTFETWNETVIVRTVTQKR